MYIYIHVKVYMQAQFQKQLDSIDNFYLLVYNGKKCAIY